MKKEIQYTNTLPQMPEAFYQNMTETLKELEEPMKKRYKAVTILVAALIVALMMAGVAFAAMQVVHSGLLDRLFPKGSPSEAEKMVVSDALSNERDGLKLTMNEHLYDGRNIHLDWTVESARDDTVYYLTNYQLKELVAMCAELTVADISSHQIVLQRTLSCQERVLGANKRRISGMVVTDIVANSANRDGDDRRNSG